MIEIEQEFLHDEAAGIQGDCMRACIASILELPISEVPHFAQLDADEGGGFMWRIHNWLKDRGLTILQVNDPDLAFPHGVGPFDEYYHIVSGPSPRNVNGRHGVVYLGDKMVWDPHPSKLGVVTTKSSRVHYYFILPRGITVRKYE